MKAARAKAFSFAAILLFLSPTWVNGGIVFDSFVALNGGTDATLVQSTNGIDLYGTTITGSDYGTVFAAPTNGIPFGFFGALYTNLGVFSRPTGGEPYAGVVLGPGGSLYGTTAFYAISNTLFRSGMGAVFSLNPVGNIFTQLHRFGTVLSGTEPLDGASPRAPLVNGPGGLLYGTTYQGGSNGYASGGLGLGTVFAISSNGTFTEWHSFLGSDGSNPTGLIVGSDSNLYGVTSHGGFNTNKVDTNGDLGFGTVFKMTTNGVWTPLYSFGAVTNVTGSALDGSVPNALVQGSDGNFYGTTMYGGSNTAVVDKAKDAGYGTVFSITTNGVLTTLYSFGSMTNTNGVPLDGGNPSGPLVEGLDGNFYGVTQFGGATNTGTIFRVTPTGALTTLFAFGATNIMFEGIGDGNYPRGGLLIGAEGDFYGTTYAGGHSIDSAGSIFRLGPAAPQFVSSSLTRTVVAGVTTSLAVDVNSIYQIGYQWQFDGTNLADGGNISGSATSNLVLSVVSSDEAGTYTILATNAAGSASESGVLTVVPAIITAQPQGSTVPAGATYVFTVGVSNVYPVTYQWQLNGTNLSDGGDISGSVTSALTISGAMPADAGLYSVIVSNIVGAVNSHSGRLTVVPFLTVSAPASQSIIAGSTAHFVLALEDDEPVTYQWQLDGTNLSDGGNVSGSMTSNLTLTAATLNQAGTYIVVASDMDGGSTNAATLAVVPFEVLSPPSSLTVIAGSNVNFNANVQSVYPMTFQWRFKGVALSDGGNISGSSTSNLTVSAVTTANTGTYSVEADNGAGATNWSVFLSVLNSTTPGCSLSNVYSFTGVSDGAQPETALVQGTDGNFYGTTRQGYGEVFRVSSDGVFSNLYAFGQIGEDGIIPTAALIQGSDGNFYGTTSAGGGNFDNGTVYEITPTGVETVLYPDPKQGAVQAGDVEGPGGILYCGDTGGDLFQLTMSGAYTLFASLPSGHGLTAAMVFGTDGNLYGVTGTGGAFLDGSVFLTSTNGAPQTLYSFTGGSDGENPESSLVEGADGAFYGSTTGAGSHGAGTLFRVTTNGGFATFYTFGNVTNWDGSALDGAAPNGLLLAGDGNFYGTTYSGGYLSQGTVFRITPDGALTTLVYFDGANGANPSAGLVEGTDGALYGTTENGGGYGMGTVYRLTMPPAIRVISQSGGKISLAWSAVAGQTYQLQYSAALNPPGWINLGNPTVATGSELTMTDALTSSQRFYRVVQIIPP